MYGTLFRAQLKPGASEQMHKLTEEEMSARPKIKGWQRSLVLEDGDDMWVLVVFDSEETYRANAAAPDQDEWYRRRRELMQSDPEWHDGPIVEEVPKK